jgi:large subunit ribosomal protein L28
MWKPNAHRKRVYSELLGHMVPLSLTAHTLRCIDKAGGAQLASSLAPPSPAAGLDSYVLNAREAELGTGEGPRLKETLLFVKRLQAQAAALVRPGASADKESAGS